MAGEVSQVVRSCQQGLVMALRRRRRAQIFQERKNVLEMFDDEQLIKRLHIFSYSKRANNCFTLKAVFLSHSKTLD